MPRNLLSAFRNWRRHCLVVGPFFTVARLQGSFDESQEAIIVDVLSEDVHQSGVINILEGFDNLLPLSTTHSMTLQKS